MSDTDPNPRFDVYRAVTDTIIAAIEAGAGEFVMPWHGPGAAIAKPENACTHMDYHGVNVIALWAQAYARKFESGYWASFKQWQEVGAQVRRGEHGATIVFFKRLGETDESQAVDTSSRVRLIARASRVFNADQVAGWQPPAPRRFGNPVEVADSVVTFVKATRAQIAHGGTRACYHVSTDTIDMPEIERFMGSPTSTASEAYMATLLHELVHWSGAKHRLDRGLADLSRADLAREELVAEIGAAFLCADLGVANQMRPDHAAYVAHWLQLLRNDSRAVFVASRLATRAATFLHEIVSQNVW